MRFKPINTIEEIEMQTVGSGADSGSDSDITMSPTTRIATMTTTTTTSTSSGQTTSVQQQGGAKYATQRRFGGSSAQQSLSAKAQTRRTVSTYRLTASFTPRCLLLALLLCFTHGKLLNEGSV